MTIRLNHAKLMELGFDRSDIAAFVALIDTRGIADQVVTATDNTKQFEEWPVTSLEAVEAKRGVDELRNELASTRGDLDRMRAMIEDLTAQIAASTQTDLRNRIELIEDRLA